MSPLSRRTRYTYLVVLSTIFIIGVPIILLYVSGYRLSLDRSFDARGGLYVYAPESNSEIYVDGELKDESTFFNRRFFSQNLKVGEHTVVVSNPRFEPWTKTITVRPNRVTSIEPFFVPQKIQVAEVRPISYDLDQDQKLVRTNNPTYLSLVETFLRRQVVRERRDSTVQPEPNLRETNDSLVSENLPTGVVVEGSDYVASSRTVTGQNIADPEALGPNVSVVAPLLPRYERGRYTVWVKDQNTIYALYDGSDEWVPEYFCEAGQLELNCQNTIQIFETDDMIRQIDFYPGSDLALLVRMDDGVYVLELDRRSQQIFKKLYDGPSDDFYVSGDNRLYVKDGPRIWQVMLE